jgi:hypothetical protein
LRRQGGTTARLLLGALSIAALCAASAQSSPAAHASVILSNKAPSPDDSDAWRWVMAAPGMNIYVSYRNARLEGSIVTAWIDREYYRNPAGIDKSIVELRQFDCARMATRRVSYLPDNSTVSAWQQLMPGSVVEHLALEACTRMNARVLKPEASGG